MLFIFADILFTDVSVSAGLWKKDSDREKVQKIMNDVVKESYDLVPEGEDFFGGIDLFGEQFDNSIVLPPQEHIAKEVREMTKSKMAKIIIGEEVSYLCYVSSG